MIKKCPRCSNENIKEEYKYCPICGFKIGTAQEVPVQEQSSKNVTFNNLRNKKFKDLESTYWK